MQYSLYLSPKPIRFDPVSQLTNVFFDDANQQIFSVRSEGATGITVKGLTATDQKPFRMDAKGKIQSIKFSPGNNILAVQRSPSSVEFISVAKGELQMHEPIVYVGKNLPIFGFVWVHAKEVAIFSSGGIDLLQVVVEKKTLKHVKGLNLTINKFEYCPAGNFALLHSNRDSILTPVIIRQGSISKLPKLELKPDRKPNLEIITLGVIYGTGAILLLQPTPTRLVEVVIYLLNGPGMAPRMSHVLRLGHGGRFALNIVDDVIVVHHQETKTSLLFDIALKGDTDPIDNVIKHSPLTTSRPIKPFQLKLPSISSESILECELYSKHWVVFTPNVVIDAEIGCLWSLEINYEALCTMVSDRVRLVEFLLQRSKGKLYLIQVLQEMISTAEYKPTNLPIIEAVFDRINAVYKTHSESTGGNAKSRTSFQPRVVVDQTDVQWQVLQNISDQEHFGKVMMVYLCSLTKHGIMAQNDISKMIVSALVNAKKFEVIQELFQFNLIQESKPLAISLLKLSSLHPIINQMVLDMLAKLNERDSIVEVLLEQGKVMDAMQIAKTLPNFEQMPARKYLEAAYVTNDPIVFHSVFRLFEQRNLRTRGYKEFNKSEQCDKYTEHYESLFAGKS